MIRDEEDDSRSWTIIDSDRVAEREHIRCRRPMAAVIFGVLNALGAVQLAAWADCEMTEEEDIFC